MTKPSLIRIKRSTMEALVSRLGHEDTPRVYTDRSFLVRELFWRRLGSLVSMSGSTRKLRVLDYGGGNGVLLPTLSRMFEEVTCVDLRKEMAERLVQADGLSNVQTFSASLTSLGMPDGWFDTIMAADVLEHILDLNSLAGEFHQLLAPGGELLVSCPSENRFYELGRRLFNYVKPEDHFRPASEVEAILGLKLLLDHRRYFPVDLSWLGVFSLARFVKPQ